MLTQANVYVADQLFATLDPTLKRLPIQDVGNCVLADTVGFIRELPHDLVSAFKSTLQETTEASLLLHVIDVADSRKLENMLTVNEVLSEIKANQVTTLLVYNKIDQVENIQPHIEFDEENQPIAVYLSAQLNQGLDLLVEAIRQKLSHEILHLEINLAAQYGKIRHCFYQLNCVRQEKINEQGEFLLDVQIDKIEWLKLSKQFPLLKRFYESTEISDK